MFLKNRMETRLETRFFSPVLLLCACPKRDSKCHLFENTPTAKASVRTYTVGPNWNVDCLPCGRSVASRHTFLLGGGGDKS